MTLEEELYIVEHLYPRAYGYLLACDCGPTVPKFNDADEMFFEPVRHPKPTGDHTEGDDTGGGEDDERPAG